MEKLTRYSPGGYGAMCEDDRGDYVRLSEIEPLIRKAVDHAKDSGIFAGSMIAEENAEELRAARDLLRWRKVGEEMPTEYEDCVVIDSAGDLKVAFFELGDWCDNKGWSICVTHWRPIGPLPEAKP